MAWDDCKRFIQKFSRCDIITDHGLFARYLSRTVCELQIGKITPILNESGIWELVKNILGCAILSQSAFVITFSVKFVTFFHPFSSVFNAGSTACNFTFSDAWNTTA